MCYYNARERDPGVAKFGIALEWGSRGRWFESSHSDQKMDSLLGLSIFVDVGVLYEVYPEREAAWKSR